MKSGWTIKELETLTDDQLVIGVLNERLSGLNPYTPLATRLKKIHAAYETPAPKRAGRPPLDRHTTRTMFDLGDEDRALLLELGDGVSMAAGLRRLIDTQKARGNA